ncbi:hypothetical protein BHM03_00059989, partial [Ensete ventricosum]
PPCQGAAIPTVGAVAPTGGRAGLGRQPLVGALQPTPFVSATLQAGVPTGGYRPYGLAVVGCAHRRRPVGCCPRERRRLPFRAAAPTSGAGLPYGLALAAADRPLAGGLAVGGRPGPTWGLAMGGRPGPAWGLAVAGHPSSSLPLLRKYSKNA